VANSAFFGNGAANLHAQFSLPGSYAYSITGSQFASSTADNVVMNVLAGGEGSTLNLTAQGDTFANSLTATNGINVNWNGALSANIDQSLFTVTGGNNTGVLINNASLTAPSTILMTNGGFESTGGADTALRVITAGPAALTLSTNTFNFDAANDFGFRMSLGASSTVKIAKNTFTDAAGGATGIQFDSLTGPGSVTLNDNLMNLTSLGTDQGIIFSSITNTLQLSGTDDNRIFNATTPYFIPFGTTTGTFLVNGTPVP